MQHNTTISLRRSEKGVVGVGGHAALVAALGHLDVAVETPAGAPGVLDEPVVLSVLGSVADGQHSVVQVIVAIHAARLVVNAARVQLEREVAGVDGDGDGADVGDGVLHLALVPGGDLHPGVDEGGLLGLVVVAVEVTRRGVRVVGLGHDAAVVHQVVEGVRLEAAVAGEVAVPAGQRLAESQREIRQSVHGPHSLLTSVKAATNCIARRLMALNIRFLYNIAMF